MVGGCAAGVGWWVWVGGCGACVVGGIAVVEMCMCGMWVVAGLVVAAGGLVWVKGA